MRANIQHDRSHLLIDSADIFDLSLIRLISPDFFRDDLDYLERVGRATTWPGFWTLANRIPYYFVWNHGLRKRLHLRISGARLIKIYEEVAERRRQSLL